MSEALQHGPATTRGFFFFFFVVAELDSALMQTGAAYWISSEG